MQLSLPRGFISTFFNTRPPAGRGYSSSKPPPPHPIPTSFCPTAVDELGRVEKVLVCPRARLRVSVSTRAGAFIHIVCFFAAEHADIFSTFSLLLLMLPIKILHIYCCHIVAQHALFALGVPSRVVDAITALFLLLLLLQLLVRQVSRYTVHVQCTVQAVSSSRLKLSMT